MRPMLLFWITSAARRSDESTSPPPPVLARRQLAHRIALDRLDLDDVGAALGEDLRAEGDGDELAELDDLDAGERARGVHGAASVAVNLLCSKRPEHERDRGGGLRYRRRG